MLYRLPQTLAIILTFLLILAPSIFAQGQWNWPEKPQNLQVFPSDWSGQRLSAPMRGFTRALGVRCSYCHVGEEGKPLSTYDFASDENPNKERAREMIRMLGSINDHLKKIEPSAAERVNMWCHTCHRGNAKPMTLDEELSAAFAGGGMETALARYKELRENYYGHGMYNFEDEGPLNSLGYKVLEANNLEGAIKIFTMNTEKFPKSGNVWDSLAEAYMVSGDLAKAEEYYKKSLEIAPWNDNAKKMLEEIEKK